MKGFRVFALSKKRLTGKKRQWYWARVVLDHAACLLELLGPRTDAEVAAADAATPDPVDDQSGQVITLRDSSPIKLRLRRYLFSKTAKVGDRIAFEVSKDVVIDGAVVIREGAIGWGTVTEAEGSKSYGRNAELNFTVDSVKAVSGQILSIRNNREKVGGTSGATVAATAAYFRLWGAFIKGKNVGIRAGTEFVTFVNGDQALKLKPEPPQE